MVKKYRKDSIVSYTLGITLTIELLKKKIEYVNRVFVHSKINKNDVFFLIERLCEEYNIPIEFNDKAFNILSSKENCFIIGEFRKFDSVLSDRSNNIVLVNPSNAGNLGTIIRTMVGFGINDLVIISPAVDIYDPKCIRASMGALFHLNFKYYDSFDKYFKENKNRNFYPFMLQASKNLSKVIVEEPYSLIFGNEATGLSDGFLNYGYSLIIKHTSNIDSLNLPIAVSIGIYEATKNRF